MKKAILVVSFGTSYQDALKNNILAVETAIGDAFPGWEVRRAFTSSIIMKKLLRRDGMEIDTVSRAMEKLEKEGYTHIAVQPTHVMHGEEYEKLLSQLEPFRQKLNVWVGEPLLDRQEDYAQAADALLSWLPPRAADEALVLMGHGSAHFANAAYGQLEQNLQDLQENVFVGTVEGYPTLERIERQLAARPSIKKIVLAPFMLVAGDHAQNDMAGDEDSWKARLEAKGYSVRCILKGLGECPAIQQIFVQHCAEAVEALCVKGKLWGVGVGPGRSGAADPESSPSAGRGGRCPGPGYGQGGQNSSEYRQRAFERKGAHPGFHAHDPGPGGPGAGAQCGGAENCCLPGCGKAGGIYHPGGCHGVFYLHGCSREGARYGL